MSLGDGASGVPAGWYPDPADDARLRRWDGRGWTQDVILAPEETPAVFVPPVATMPQAAAQAATPPPVAFAQTPPPPAAPTTTSFAPQPAAEPAAPASSPSSASAASASPAASVAPPGSGQPNPSPTIPRASSVGNDRFAHSGPISLPEWESLPGLTLPPDLSELDPELEDTILHPPKFFEPAEETPASDWGGQASFVRPPFVEEPEPPRTAPAQQSSPFAPSAPAFAPSTSTFAPSTPAFAPSAPPPVNSAPSFAPPATPNFPPPARPTRAGGMATAPEQYAPPPAGAQYDVPPPPGAAWVPGPSLALPASSLVAPKAPAGAWVATPVPSLTDAAPVDFESLPRTSVADEVEASGAPNTIWTWLMAILPLVQFAVVYLVFVTLDVTFAPGTQWAVILAPAVFGLIFANIERKKLVDEGFLRAPSPLLAIVPPIYLLVRAFDVGRTSAIALGVWIVAQAIGVAGVIILLPHVLDIAIKSLI